MGGVQGRGWIREKRGSLRKTLQQENRLEKSFHVLFLLLPYMALGQELTDTSSQKSTIVVQVLG